MEELIYISLFVLVLIFIIWIVHCFCFCYLKYKRKSKLTIDSPPPYDQLVLDKKHLPKFKDVV